MQAIKKKKADLNTETNVFLTVTLQSPRYAQRVEKYSSTGHLSTAKLAFLCVSTEGLNPSQYMMSTRAYRNHLI